MIKNKIFRLDCFQWLCKFSFGTFERHEFQRFCQLGVIFTLILGSYTALRPIKDAVFIGLAGQFALPYAKTISIIGLFPLLMIYSKALDNISKKKILKAVPAVYGSIFLVFSLVILFVEDMPTELTKSIPILLVGTKLIGYLWYFLVESFGSLIVALFWAFATNNTDPNSAGRGFPLIVAFGQFGGIIIPFVVVGLPYRYGVTTNSFSIFLIGILILSIIFLVRYLLKSISDNAQIAFNNDQNSISNDQQGSLTGLKLIIKNPYLSGIFLVVFIYELITTILDFNFKITAANVYSGVALTNYLSIYASTVNIVAFLSLVLGISNFTRFLGVGAAIILVPIIYIFCLSGFLMVNSLNFLFWLMVFVKSVNYSLNSPALKQLYIPTQVSVRFKAQAWIEAFGTRLGKASGSMNNMLLNSFQANFGLVYGHWYYFLSVACLGFPLLMLWLIAAFFLNKRFYDAVTHDKFIC